MTVRDPVCGMMVDKSRAVTLEKDGQTYYCCSEHCKRQFQSQVGSAAAPGIHAGHETHAAHGEKEQLAAHAAHGRHAQSDAGHHAHMVADFRRRFWVSLVLTIPVVVLSPMIQDVLGLREVLRFPGDTFVLFGLSTVIFFYGGWPFLKGLFEELGKREPGMMTLIALAISVAYVYSSAVVFGLTGAVFFWELATLIDVMLLGHWIEMRSVMGASRALESLVQLMPSEAHA